MGTASTGDEDAMQLKAPARDRSDTNGSATLSGAASPGSARRAGRTDARLPLAAYAARLQDRRMPIHSAAPRPVAAKTVGSFVPRLTRPAFERYGFSAAAIVTDWDTIVGADIAKYTMPERLKWPKRVTWTGDEVSDDERGRPGATLVLAVAAGRALDVQYKSAQLVERINNYFGYRAITELRIVQVSQIKPPQAVAVPPATPVAAMQASKPREELAQISAPGLRAALERMAEGLGARTARRHGRA
ncbi:MAG: DUF721 domain-containing protein [Hyphomicrobiaceae bacterium]